MSAGVYFTTQEHYYRIFTLIELDPSVIEVVTYSTGRVRNDREVVYGSFASDLNFLGLALQEIQERLKANRIHRCTVVTTEPPQEVEAIEEFNRIQWRQHTANHAKVWLFRYPAVEKYTRVVALLGSRNLTSTIFHEATVELDNQYDAVGVRRIGEFVESIIKQSISLEGHQDWFGQVDQLGI